MTNDLESAAIFVKVGDAKGFSAAAALLGMTASAVSKHVSRLEDSLGVQLVIRSTHNFRLTEAGVDFHQRCRKVLKDFAEARTAAQNSGQAAKGSLRIHATPGIGQRIIEPEVVAFLDRHPEFSVDLKISAELPNPLDQGYDVALRTGGTDDRLMSHASLQWDDLGALHFFICASDRYLTTFGRPETETDLSRHNCLVHSTQSSARKWRFGRNGADFDVPVRGSLVSNSHTAVADAMNAGIGIARILALRPPALRPDVRILFSGPTLPARALRAFHPAADHVPMKTKLLLEFLRQRLTFPEASPRHPPASRSATG